MAKRTILVLLAAILQFTQTSGSQENDHIQELSKANLKFTLDFYKTAAGQDQYKTFVSSPTSASILFTMLWIGARGDTAEEIQKTLHLHDTRLGLNEVQSGYRAYLGADGTSPKPSAEITNTFWNSKNFKASQEYEGDLQKNFNAKGSELDFSTPEATKTINDFVKKETNDKIPALFGEPLPSSTVMVLVNTIYFKGNWKTKFPVSKTTSQNFHGENGDTSVSMMNEKSKFKYAQCQTLKSEILEMDYEAGNMSMVVILPNEDSNLNKMEKTLTTDSLAECMNRLRVGNVDVSLPKFKIETSFDLIPIMQKLNTKKVFTSSADLSGISPGLYVSDAIQKAFVLVDEEGTEAAAASAAATTRTAVIEQVFQANRPFTFLIRNTENNMVLFMGRYL